MSPAEFDARHGCFAIRRGQARSRADVSYGLLTEEVERRLAAPRYDLVSIASIEVALQYGCSQRATKEPVGTPILRMNNLQADGWDLTDLKYVDITADELRRWRLERRDIVFNRTNSKELVGKCEVFDQEGTWVFASYLMRLRVDESQADPDFVSAFLNSKAGRVQIDRESRLIIGMANINAEEIRKLRIPLPKLAKQQELMATLSRARDERDRRLVEAEHLLAELEPSLLNALGFATPSPHDPSKPFAVRLKVLRDRRIDPPAHAPFPIPENPRRIPIKPLAEIADIDANVADLLPEDDMVVPYVGLPECDLNHVREVATRPFAEVKGRSIARVGDILFARIEPSIFNKKYVYVDRLDGHELAYLSTEFYTVRARGDDYDQRYLYALLLSTVVSGQLRGKTTGSSGRRRLDRDMFASLLIPWPDRNIRIAIAADAARRRDDARLLREEARTGWDEAKRRFEGSLLGQEALAGMGS